MTFVRIIGEFADGVRHGWELFLANGHGHVWDLYSPRAPHRRAR